LDQDSFNKSERSRSGSKLRKANNVAVPVVEEKKVSLESRYIKILKTSPISVSEVSIPLIEDAYCSAMILDADLISRVIVSDVCP
jgi:hypothetical protein